MAIAIATPAQTAFANVFGGPVGRLTVTQITGDTSYPTGGTAVTAAQLGLNSVGGAICTVQGSAANNTATGASYNVATGKLQMWATTGTTPDANTEAANASNLSGLTITVLAWGF